MLTYLYFSALILAPILVTLFFRKYVQENPAATVEDLEGAYTRVTLFTIGASFGSVFAPASDMTSDIVKANFALTIMSFLWVQYDYSKAVEVRRPATTPGTAPTTTSPLAFLKQSFRGILFVGCLYLLLYFFSIFGLAIFFFATPLFIRVLFTTLPMNSSPLYDNIKEVFRNAGVDLGHIRIIQTGAKKNTNAMVCGTKFGFGPFKRTLLVTDNLFSRLSEDEFMAVMRHEAAHFKLNHIRKRLFSVVVAYLTSLFVVVVPVVTALSISYRVHLQSRTFEAVLTLIATVGALFFMNHTIFSTIHQHEHEADVEAVKMGSTPEAMISALQKITDDHGANYKKKSFLRRLLLSHAHPSLEERIEVVRQGQVKPHSFLPPTWTRVAGAYALMIACTLYCLQTTSSTKQNREIASETEQPAKISH